MTENSTGTISVVDAVGMLMQPAELPEEPETEAEIVTDDNEAEVEELAGDDQEETAEIAVEIEIEGEKRRLTAEEIRTGVMLQSDYTRKTQQIAEERKTLAAKEAEIAALKSQLVENLTTWAVPTEQEPNWRELAAKLPPQEYIQRQAAWAERQQIKAAAVQQRQALVEAEHARLRQAETERLFEAVPEWRDHAKFVEASKELVERGAEYGFAAEEIAGISDHRLALVLKDAIAYRKLKSAQAEVTKKVAAAPVALKPGAKPNANTAQLAERQKLEAQLKKTGSREVAAKLLMMR